MKARAAPTPYPRHPVDGHTSALETERRTPSKKTNLCGVDVFQHSSERIVDLCQEAGASSAVWARGKICRRVSVRPVRWTSAQFRCPGSPAVAATVVGTPSSRVMRPEDGDQAHVTGPSSWCSETAAAAAGAMGPGLLPPAARCRAEAFGPAAAAVGTRVRLVRNRQHFALHLVRLVFAHRSCSASSRAHRGTVSRCRHRALGTRSGAKAISASSSRATAASSHCTTGRATRPAPHATDAPVTRGPHHEARHGVCTLLVASIPRGRKGPPA